MDTHILLRELCTLANNHLYSMCSKLTTLLVLIMVEAIITVVITVVVIMAAFSQGIMEVAIIDQT